MSLRADLERLSRAHAEQLEGLRGLRVTIVEDRPLDRDLALIDGRADALDALTGVAEEGLRAARSACAACTTPLDWPSLERALQACAHCHEALDERCWAELSRHDRVLEIVDLARRHRGEWSAWASGVLAGCDDCQRAARSVRGALIQAWHALFEYAAASGEVCTHAALSNQHESRFATTSKENAHVIE
jgi:hypothetical protein